MIVFFYPTKLISPNPPQKPNKEERIRMLRLLRNGYDQSGLKIDPHLGDRGNRREF
jgi:hypothetical protein